MSAVPGFENGALTVALDLRHPLAYLALEPSLAFGRELDLAIDWLPRATQTLRPPTEPQPDDDRGVRHRRHRAHMIAREIEVYGAAQGLTIREPYRDGPTDAANAGWLWMRSHARAALEPFLVELFRRYWRLDLDADDLAAVARVVEAVGGDSAGFERWARAEGSAAVASAADALEAAGVFNVPAYLVADQVFYGRQHLPMIRWLLAGRQGPVPI